MRAAISLILLGLLAACQQPAPDFSFSQLSPDESRIATIRGFQPRGTIEGYVLLSFNRDQQDAEATTLRRIVNGVMGWVSDDTFAVVADQIQLSNLSTEYYPHGTTDTKVRVVVCTKSDMDCTKLLERLGQSSKTRRIARFPEG